MNYPDYAMNLTENHPIRAYLEENTYLQALLTELNQTDSRSDSQKFFNLFNHLCEIEKKFSRKENQLFPYLEKRGWNGPSQGMWAFHDSIRDLLRGIRHQLNSKNTVNLAQETAHLTSEIQRLMMIEESRLFPISMHILNDEDWAQMILGEHEIGWMIPHKHSPTPVQSQNEDLKDNSGRFKLEEGHLSHEQISLLLQVMPFDITYVDENDRVVFYNRGEERVFPRSAGIIGREVRFCHPPKSVDTVLKILEAFRSGEQSVAEFWIDFKGRKVHIRYFAVRDKELRYKGVIEITQDVTAIQKLQGQQRLLDWSLTTTEVQV